MRYILIGWLLLHGSGDYKLVGPTIFEDFESCRVAQEELVQQAKYWRWVDTYNLTCTSRMTDSYMKRQNIKKLK